MADINRNDLWELLWNYDPNGLIVVDLDMTIKVVNPSFCKMFQVVEDEVIGQSASKLLDDLEDFKRVWETKQVIRGKEKHYRKYDLYVEKVIFPIESEEIVACIMVDITHELERKQEITELKNETVKKVNEVVNNQMKVAQEIASLLGETTAETKVSLLKIIQMLQQ